MRAADDPPSAVEFGYYPRPLSLDGGPVHIRTLDDLSTKVRDVQEDDYAERDWIYSPMEESRTLGGDVITKPYPSRVFTLPKTHTLAHDNADSAAHLEFQVAVFSFLVGIRLTTTEAGFLDATPIKPGKLVDFVLLGDSLRAGIELAEKFWVDNAASPQNASRLLAAIHALFLAQNPRYLQFETFIYLYTCLDACFALESSLHPPQRKPSHAARTEWMCGQLGICIPEWASTSAGTGIAGIRNPTLHEGLYVDAPLGFALLSVPNQNLNREMTALACRIVIALLGARDANYLQSMVTFRQRIGLRLTAA